MPTPPCVKVTTGGRERRNRISEALFVCIVIGRFYSTRSGEGNAGCEPLAYQSLGKLLAIAYANRHPLSELGRPSELAFSWHSFVNNVIDDRGVDTRVAEGSEYALAAHVSGPYRAANEGLSEASIIDEQALLESRDHLGYDVVAIAVLRELGGELVRAALAIAKQPKRTFACSSRLLGVD